LKKLVPLVLKYNDRSQLFLNLYYIWGYQFILSSTSDRIWFFYKITQRLTLFSTI
jgi:hypothetical protein